MREAIAGEKELEEREEERLMLRRSLGLSDEHLNVNKEDSTPNDSTCAVSVRTIRRRQRVGTRSPVRDKIGVKVG